MPRLKLDRATRKVLQDARSMIEAVARADGNEAETRSRVEYLFKIIMGYDPFEHITREHAISGVGDAVHCDFALQLDHKESSRPIILVELKRVNIDLQQKHLKQAASYAINIGCEWALLTNGMLWKLYHISYGQPPQTKLVDSWNLMTDDLAALAENFNTICYKSVKKGSLARLWEKSNVPAPQNLLKVILSEESIRVVRRGLKKSTDVAVSPEDIIGGIRHLLNEAAASEMDMVRISLPATQQSKRTTTAKGRGKKADAAA